MCPPKTTKPVMATLQNCVDIGEDALHTHKIRVRVFTTPMTLESLNDQVVLKAQPSGGLARIIVDQALHIMMNVNTPIASPRIRHVVASSSAAERIYCAKTDFRENFQQR